MTFSSEVLDLDEALGGLGPDAASRRVLGGELGMLLLDLLQLVEEAVVLRVGDLRLVEHVVAVQVVLDLLAQLVDARP